MSARTIPDQAVAHDNFVQRVPAEASAATPLTRTAQIFSTSPDRRHNSATKPNQPVEPVDPSSPPVIREDAASLMRVSWRLESLVKQHGPRIAFKARGTILLLNLFDIVAVQAEGNYVSLQHRPHHHLVHESLSSMADKLKPFGFIRIHRSVVVNISAVEEIQPLATGEYRLRVRGGREYLVTRTYKHNLKNLAQLWVGTDRLCGD